MPVSTLSETQQASTAATAASAAGWPAAIPAGTRFTPFGRLGRTTLARRWLTEVACNGAVVTDAALLTVAAVVTDALLTVAAVVTNAGLAYLSWFGLRPFMYRELVSVMRSVVSETLVPYAVGQPGGWAMR